MLTGYKTWKTINEAFQNSFTLGVKTPRSIGAVGSKLAEMGFHPHEEEDDLEDDLDNQDPELGGEDEEELGGLGDDLGDEEDDLDDEEGLDGEDEDMPQLDDRDELHAMLGHGKPHPDETGSDGMPPGAFGDEGEFGGEEEEGEFGGGKSPFGGGDEEGEDEFGGKSPFGGGEEEEGEFGSESPFGGGGDEEEGEFGGGKSPFGGKNKFSDKSPFGGGDEEGEDEFDGADDEEGMDDDEKPSFGRDDDEDEDEFEDEDDFDGDEEEPEKAKAFAKKKAKKYMSKGCEEEMPSKKSSSKNCKDNEETMYSKKYMGKRGMKEEGFFDSLVNMGRGEVHKKFGTGLNQKNEDLLLPYRGNDEPGPGEVGFAPHGKIGGPLGRVSESKKGQKKLSEVVNKLSSRQLVEMQKMINKRLKNR